MIPNLWKILMSELSPDPLRERKLASLLCKPMLWHPGTGCVWTSWGFFSRPSLCTSPPVESCFVSVLYSWFLSTISDLPPEPEVSFTVFGSSSLLGRAFAALRGPLDVAVCCQCLWRAYYVYCAGPETQEWWDWFLPVSLSQPCMICCCPWCPAG